MSFVALLVCQSLLTQARPGSTEPEHAKNPIYEAVRTAGFKADGTVARLADPLLRDGMAGEEQRDLAEARRIDQGPR